MERRIELKHVAARAHVRALLDERIDRLEGKLAHFASEAVSVHVVFEENGTHKVFHVALTCHVPGRTVAAHQEGRDAGTAIRRSFAEVERQLAKYRTALRRQHGRARGKPLREP